MSITKNSTNQGTERMCSLCLLRSEGLVHSMLKEAAARGVAKALREAPLVLPYVTIQEAEDKVGKEQLDLWVKEGKIELFPFPGEPDRIDKKQISEVSRMTFT